MHPDETAEQQTTEQTVLYCRVDASIDPKSLTVVLDDGVELFYSDEAEARKDSQYYDTDLYRVVFEKIDTIPADLDEDEDEDEDEE